MKEIKMLQTIQKGYINITIIFKGVKTFENIIFSIKNIFTKKKEV